MKKILNYLAALVLAIVCSVATVSAASITITNTVEGQTYSVYKIFDVTRSGDSYAYSIESTNAWFEAVKAYASDSAFTLTKASGSDTKYVVTLKAENNEAFAKAFATYLNGKKSDIKPTTSKKAEGTTTEFTGLAAGYYFVDSSLGALCILHTAADTFTMAEKNVKPTVTKNASQETAGVGQIVNFTITVKAGGAADTSYIVRDTMTEGLELDATSISIRVGENEVLAKNYTKETSKNGFVIEFNLGYTATLNSGDEIVITYSAMVNEKAIEKSEVENTATIKYGNTTSTESKVVIPNYDFTLKKVNKNNEQLGDAHFKLYTAETGGTEIKLTLVTLNDGTKFYRPALKGETVEEIIAGNVSIKGLASGTYYLEETKAPDGYNQLTKRVEVVLNGEDTTITVENTTGAQLPHTGGMGTVLFITIGSIMVLGFGVLLVTKLRISKMYI